MGDDGQANANANPTVDAVSNVRLPAFWKQSPALWFSYAESILATQRITSNASKTNFVVAALDEEAVRNIGDLLLTAASYTDVRSRLIDVYGVSQAARFREIVKPGGLGDRRPSQLLRDMRSSMPPSLGEDALKEFWLQKLPSNVTAILASLDAPLNELAARADRVLEASNPQCIDVLSRDQFNDLAGAVSALSLQVQSLTKMVGSAGEPSRQQPRAPTQLDVQQPAQSCYYHARFGSRARTCRPPCNFKPKSGKNSAAAPAEN